MSCVADSQSVGVLVFWFSASHVKQLWYTRKVLYAMTPPKNEIHKAIGCSVPRQPLLVTQLTHAEQPGIPYEI